MMTSESLIWLRLQKLISLDQIQNSHITTAYRDGVDLRSYIALHSYVALRGATREGKVERESGGTLEKREELQLVELCVFPPPEGLLI
jgi:hypothetical protein